MVELYDCFWQLCRYICLRYLLAIPQEFKLPRESLKLFNFYSQHKFSVTSIKINFLSLLFQSPCSVGTRLKTRFLWWKKSKFIVRKIKNGFICVLECNSVRHQHSVSHIFNHFVHSRFCHEKYWRNKKMCPEHQRINWNVLHEYCGSSWLLWILLNWPDNKMDALLLFSDFWDIICVLAHSIMLYEG